VSEASDNPQEQGSESFGHRCAVNDSERSARGRDRTKCFQPVALKLKSSASHNTPTTDRLKLLCAVRMRSLLPMAQPLTSGGRSAVKLCGQ
jgi:hypothetical protein